MTPQHHEERLRMWAVHTGKPVLALDYGKAPECMHLCPPSCGVQVLCNDLDPFPFASDEAFDVYRILDESNGAAIGMSGRRLRIILSGDSAGAMLAVNVMNQILTTQAARGLQKPAALVLNYAALDFNFTSWMTPANLRVLRSAQSAGDLAAGVAARDHFAKASPLSMVSERSPRANLRRRRSWRDVGARKNHLKPAPIPEDAGALTDDGGAMADAEGEELRPSKSRTTPSKEDKLVEDRVTAHPAMTQSTLERKQVEFSVPPSEKKASEKPPIGTRMTMTVSANSGLSAGKNKR